MTPSYVRPAFVEYVCDRYVRRVAVTGSAMPDRSNEFSRSYEVGGARALRVEGSVRWARLSSPGDKTATTTSTRPLLARTTPLMTISEVDSATRSLWSFRVVDTIYPSFIRARPCERREHDEADQDSDDCDGSAHHVSTSCKGRALAAKYNRLDATAGGP